MILLKFLTSLALQDFILQCNFVAPYFSFAERGMLLIITFSGLSCLGQCFADCTY